MHTTLNTLADAGEDFYRQLAVLLYEKLPPPDTTENHYNANDYDSYVEVIASAVSSIGNALGGMANKKALEKQAGNQTLQTLMAYEEQKQVLALKQAQIAQQQQAIRQKQRSVQQTVLALAGIAVACIGGWQFLKPNNRELMTQNAIT